jgi:membrane-bound lytic murein transglycosylase D
MRNLLYLLLLIFLSSCSLINQFHPETPVAEPVFSREDSLRTELVLKEKQIDSLYFELDEMNYVIDSLQQSLEICNSRVAYDPGFHLPDTIRFAGRLFDLTNERLYTKLEKIYNLELQAAHKYIPRSGKYFPMIEAILSEYHIPDDVKYLAIVESRLSPLAYSGVGAMGMWQFMKPTATGFGLKVNDFIDERKHVIKSTIAAAQYLQSNYDYLSKRGAEDWLLALSAYNAGAGNIAKAMREQGGTDFFDLILKSDESHSFVWRAVATKIIFENQEEIFGQTFALEPPLQEQTRTIELNLKGYHKIDEWAQAQGTNVSKVWELNPWINIYQRERSKYSPVNDVVLPPGTFSIMLPADSEPDPAALAAVQNQLLQENNGFFTHHVVKKGDTLYDIARKYKTTISNIKNLNGLRSSVIYPGQKLKLFGSSSSTGNYYVVKSGDSVSVISDKLGVSMNHLIAKNNLTNKNGIILIKPGQKLYY